jgi:glucose/arabinose dehydrogenase
MKRVSTLILMLVACSGDPTPPPTQPPPPAALSLELVSGGLNNPVYLTAAPNDQQRLFVVEQVGRIRIIRNGQLVATPFLDIRSKVVAGGEQGLFSMAFHPNYATNGWFFVNYTDTNGDTQVERYSVSSNADVADPASAHQAIFVDQPFGNHNGGQLQFGPDGNLYIGMGDGGSAGDPQGHGQNRATLLGDLLRINVDQSNVPYTIPADNPYAGSTQFRPEIWAYGLRNPWRFSFDRPSNTLYIADVGQNAFEEINAVPATEAGVNYGWKIMEARHCFTPSTNCNQTGLKLPVHEYAHGSGGTSVTGGYVYRGTRIPGVVGHYFYADFYEGVLRSFLLVNGVATDHRTWNVGPLSFITSFGVDAAGELYILTASDGSVRRIAP